MYYEPQPYKLPQKPTCYEDAVSVCERWTDKNMDFVEIPSDEIRLGITKGHVALCPPDDNEGFAMTRQAMSSLLKRLSLPTSLAGIFDKPGSQGILPNYDARVERGMDFVGGVMKDAKIPLTLRARGDYVRCVLGPSDLLLDYSRAMKTTVRALRKEKWVEREKMFKEFQPSDQSLAIALTESGKSLGIAPKDRLFSGVKLVFSENAEARNDVYSYVWRLVCSNGLIAPTEVASRFISLRGLKNDFRGAVRNGIHEALGNSQMLAEGAYRLRGFKIPKGDATEKLERFGAVIDRVAPTVHIPRGDRESLATVWSMQRDRSLYGLMNSMTALARERQNEDRANLERAAGRLVFQRDARLEALVK